MVSRTPRRMQVVGVVQHLNDTFHQTLTLVPVDDDSEPIHIDGFWIGFERGDLVDYYGPDLLVQHAREIQL